MRWAILQCKRVVQINAMRSNASSRRSRTMHWSGVQKFYTGEQKFCTANQSIRVMPRQCVHSKEQTKITPTTPQNPKSSNYHSPGVYYPPSYTKQKMWLNIKYRTPLPRTCHQRIAQNPKATFRLNRSSNECKRLIEFLEEKSPVSKWPS